MNTWQRHQLALLSDAGWQRVLSGAWDDEARHCLAHWAGRRWPLVVTRQRPQTDGAGDSVCLGLPAPGLWRRRRIALAVARADIARRDAFPLACRLSPLLPGPQRRAWRALCGGLSALGASARVYGSHGWQLLTGLDHLREGSDIDLCIAVDRPVQADAVAVLLQSWSDGLRLDGELMFPCGSAVAWREWLAWRAQRTPAVLVKRLDGVALASTPFWPVAETV
jgi:phosphoribosyl-dephospho-CoA transferase